MVASLAGVMCSCEEDDKLVTNADSITVSAGTLTDYVTPNTARVKVWFNKKDYPQIKTAGVLYGITKDLDYLITYGYDLNEEFTGNDTTFFDVAELDPKTTYYYVGYCELHDGTMSYSGIRFWQTLKDEISITPGLVTFDPVNATDLTADTICKDIVVKTEYLDWSVEIDEKAKSWIKDARRVDDTTLHVVAMNITDMEDAKAGRSGQIRISATSGEGAIKSRSVLVNQLPVTTTMAQPADYVYNVVATGGPVMASGVGNVNAPLDLDACEYPEWITSISRSNTGGIVIVCDVNPNQDARDADIKLVTSLTGDENIVKVHQVSGITLGSESVELGYAEGSTANLQVITYKGEVRLGTQTADAASAEFLEKFKIDRPRGGGLSFSALTTNNTLNDFEYTLDVIYKDGDNVLTAPVKVIQKATTFSIDVDNFEFPKSPAEYYVVTSREGATIDCEADWIEATVNGTTVTIKTTSDATSERTATVNIVWGEHVCPVTVKQLTVNDGVAMDGTQNITIDLPYGETAAVAVDFNDMLSSFGLTSTAMDAYYILSTSSDKGKPREDTKSIIWRALLADGTPFLSALGANQYTGEGYGSYYDAAGNATYKTEGLMALNFDETTGMINVLLSETAEVGATYSGQLQLLYTQPAEGKENTYTVNVTVNVGTPLLKELSYDVTVDEEPFEEKKIDSLLAYALYVNEEEVASLIADGSIEFVGVNVDGTEVSAKTYGVNGFIFDASGNVGTYPNPVYVEYSKSKLVAGLIEGVVTKAPAVSCVVKFKYNGVELPITINF